MNRGLFPEAQDYRDLRKPIKLQKRSVTRLVREVSSAANFETPIEESIIPHNVERMVIKVTSRNVFSKTITSSNSQCESPKPYVPYVSIKSKRNKEATTVNSTFRRTTYKQKPELRTRKSVIRVEKQVQPGKLITLPVQADFSKT